MEKQNQNPIKQGTDSGYFCWDSLKGNPGKDGESATVNVKGTNTIPYNQPASVVNDGIQPHAWLTFNIPQGIPGEPGKCDCNPYIYLGQWVANSSYPLTFKGSKVYVSAGNKFYENLSDNNLNNNPTSNPTKWNLIFG